MKYLLGCLCSALVGAGLAWAALHSLGRESSPVHPPESLTGIELQVAPTPRNSTPDSGVSRSSAPTVTPGTEQGRSGLTPEERVNVAVYERVNRSVVNINTRTVREDSFLFFDAPTESSGAGSGSVLDKQGHILTNFHVVEGAREIMVTLFDGQGYRAELVGQDPYTDMAVLKIDAPEESLHPVVLGDSLALQVGQKVYAIGNPFGLERTLTVGIVSSLNRTLPIRHSRRLTSIIQTDAAINPGSSGGPLLNSRGEVIGMNTAIASRTGQSAGVGFAIPVSAIKRIVPQLVRQGRVIRADSGISQVLESEQGLIVAAVTPGGPAEQAGLQGFRIVTERRRQGPFVYESRRVDRSAADRIVAIEGEPVTRADQLLDIVESKQPGDTVTFTIVREGRRMDVPLRLVEQA